MSAYPVVVRATDLLLCLVPLLAIGALSALTTSQFAKKRI